MDNVKDELFFIINPHAGSGKTMKHWIPAEEKLDRLRVKYVTAYTDHRRHAMELAFEAAQEGYRKIFAVGGDGSLHEAFNGVLKWCALNDADSSGFKIGVIPIGSGNDWIKSLQVPNDAGKIIDIIAEDSFRPMDIVTVSSVGGKIRAMANVGGIGFDSHVCKRVNLQKANGMRHRMIYARALVYNILHAISINVKVIADGQERYNGSLYSIALGNGPYSGGGMRQVPLAKIDDGLLDVMLCPVMPLTKLLKEIPRLFKGNAHEAEFLHSFQCRELQIIPLDEKSNDLIEIDGEIEGRLPATIRVTGNTIKVLKPLF